MESSLSPGIVVLNRKYFPRDCLTSAQVGASSFALSVLQILRESRILCGVVLYQRDENITDARCELDSYLNGDIPVITVFFHFRMSQLDIAMALGDAYTQITACHPRRHSPPIVYYQTDALLDYHPPTFQFCVTHHGPFVSDFSQQFSPSLAQLAFGGAADKVQILEEQQTLGIRRIAQDDLGTVLAHSRMQQRFLEGCGLSRSKFRHLRPPIEVPPCDDSMEVLPRNIRGFISGTEILLFTTVARFDYFKNVELLVDVGLNLLDRSIPAKVLLVGDPEGDDTRRRAIIESIPVSKREHFLVLPRLSKDVLYSLFASVRANGVFVCPSRYETLGITPLEAAISGVATLIADSPKVEASAYFPATCRVPLKSEKIAAKIQLIYHEGISSWASMVQERVRPEASLAVFRTDLLGAWASMSKSPRRVSRHRLPEMQLVRNGDDKLKGPSITVNEVFPEPSLTTPVLQLDVRV